MRKISAVQINKKEWCELLKTATEEGKLVDVNNWGKWIDKVVIL